MPVPQFNPTLTGSAPNQLSSWDAYQAEVQRVLGLMWDGKADLGNSGKIFEDRAAAVEAGQGSLPASIRRIVTEEGDFLVLRAPFAQSPDPLFPTSPYWGEVKRFPNTRLLDEKADAQDLLQEAQSRAAAISAVNGRATPRYESREAAVAAVPTLPAEVEHIFVKEGQSLVLRAAGATTNALFGTAPTWGVSATYPEAETVISPIKGLTKDAKPAWGRAFGRGDGEAAQGVAISVLDDAGASLLAWDRRRNAIVNYGMIFGRGDQQTDLPPLSLVSEDGVLLNPKTRESYGLYFGRGDSQQDLPPLVLISEGGVLLNPGVGVQPPEPAPDDYYTDPDYNIEPQAMWRGIAPLYALWDQLLAEFPDYIAKRSLGQDALGSHIYAYEFTPRAKRIDAPNNPANLAIPRIIIQGGLHGNERNAKKAVLTMARSICRDWRTRGGVYQDLRIGARLVFIPITNPSGEEADVRVNHNNVDLNRNFDVDWAGVPVGNPTDPQGFYKGPSPASELETQILQNLPTVYPDMCAVLDSHEFNEETMFWVGTPTVGVQHWAIQTLDHLTAWFRREIAPNTGDAQIIGKMNSTPPGSGTMYFDSIGLPAVLVEANSNRQHPAYGGGGGTRLRSIVSEVVLIEALHMLLRRENLRRSLINLA